MVTESELESRMPSHVREWQRTNPKAYEIYKHELIVDPTGQIPVLQRKVQTVANEAIEAVNTQHQDVWKTFKSAAQQLEDPNDSNQIMALYDAIYEKLEFENKKKLAYHMAY